MAFSEGAPDNQVVNVRLQWEGGPSDILMEASEMRQLPAQAMAAITARAEEMLRGRPLLRLTYVDEDGDHCTLVEGSIHDALVLATPGAEGIWVLRVSIYAGPAPVAEPMPASQEATSEVVNVRLQWEGGSSDILMEASRMRQLPAEAMAAITARAEEMLRGRPLLRLTYVDEDGDHCTLVEGSIRDALVFATPGAEGISVLHVSICARPAPVAEPTSASQEVAPPAVGAAQSTELSPKTTEEPTPALAERLECLPAFQELEVHLSVACDACDQSPILGKRFKCLECHDYDLCERCFKRNRVDSSVHRHQTWAQIKSDSHAPPHVLARVDGEDVAVCHGGVVCAGCKADPIVGSRFKCTTVPNHDLCAECYHRRAEVSPSADQSFEELVLPTLVPSVAPEHVVQAVQDTEAPAQSEAESKPEELPPLSALEGASALKALASHLDDDLCLLALEALMKHPDERLCAAAAKEAVAAALAPPPPESASLLVPEPEVKLLEPETTVELEAVADNEPKPDDVPMAHEAEKDKEGLNSESAAMAVEEDWALDAKLSATVLSSSQLVLGVEASEDEAARGDVTEEFEETLQLVPSARQAYCCGRMLLPTSAETSSVPAEAKLVMLNDGGMPWPEATHLSFVAGNPFGLASMSLGSMQPGGAEEVIMDFTVPQMPEPGSVRSAWSMTDAATGQSFGPLIFFEVAWTQM